MAALLGPSLCGGRPALFFHFENFLQNAAQKLGGLDDDNLHGLLLSLPAHAAASAGDQQTRHKEQEKSRGKNGRNQNAQAQRHSASP